MAIHGIVGLPGFGKTLYGVHLLRRCKGRRRISNLFPRSGEWEFGLWDAICSTGHAMCLIDEAPNWFDSRQHGSTPVEDLMPWRQHRKQGLDLYYTAQDFGQIDKQIRVLTAFMHLVKKFGNFIIVTSYYPEELDKPAPKPFKRRMVYVTPGDYNSYWTEQTIGDKNGRGYELGRLARKRPEPPIYRGIKNRLSGPELVYVLPSHYSILCREAVLRFEWSTVDELMGNVRRAKAAGLTILSAMYGIRWELDCVTGLVKWSQSDYLKAKHPHAVAVQAAFERLQVSEEVQELAAARLRVAQGLPERSGADAMPRKSTLDLDRSRGRAMVEQNVGVATEPRSSSATILHTTPPLQSQCGFWPT